MSGKSYLIGIAGPSGAGKSYLARHLSDYLRAPVLSLDHYYRDLSHLPLDVRACSNFDDPSALEHDLLVAHVAQLADGRPIAVPTYDFSLHTRTAYIQPFEPSAFVIVEGLFTLHWPELCHLLATRVYVEMTDDVCLQRRQERDIRERGRTPDSVVEQFRATVIPMANRYVRPTQERAHVVVFGAAPIGEEVERVLEHIRLNTRELGPNAADHLRRTLSPAIPSR